MLHLVLFIIHAMTSAQQGEGQQNVGSSSASRTTRSQQIKSAKEKDKTTGCFSWSKCNPKNTKQKKNLRAKNPNPNPNPTVTSQSPDGTDRNSMVEARRSEEQSTTPQPSTSGSKQKSVTSAEVLQIVE